MINLKQATALAKDFLQGNGIWGISLQEVHLKENKWVVSFKPTFLTAPLYIVEIEKETGEIIGFRKGAIE